MEIIARLNFRYAVGNYRMKWSAKDCCFFIPSGNNQELIALSMKKFIPSLSTIPDPIVPSIEVLPDEIAVNQQTRDNNGVDPWDMSDDE